MVCRSACDRDRSRRCTDACGHAQALHMRARRFSNTPVLSIGARIGSLVFEIKATAASMGRHRSRDRRSRPTPPTGGNGVSLPSVRRSMTGYCNTVLPSDLCCGAGAMAQDDAVRWATEKPASTLDRTVHGDAGTESTAARADHTAVSKAVLPAYGSTA